MTDNFETETQTMKPEGQARFTWHMAVAATAVVAFIALVVIWFNSGSFKATPWFIALVVLMVAAIITQIILLLTGPSMRNETDFAAWDAQETSGLVQPPAEEMAFEAGCPGCGTVFPVTAAEVEAGEFSCHHCGRAGFVKDHDLNLDTVKMESCQSCGHEYREFVEFSECPNCHTYNEY